MWIFLQGWERSDGEGCGEPWRGTNTSSLLNLPLQGGTKSPSALSHPLPSGVGTKRAEGTQTLGQGGTCSELRNQTTFPGTANVLGKSEAQREAREAAKEQRREELKKD